MRSRDMRHCECFCDVPRGGTSQKVVGGDQYFATTAFGYFIGLSIAQPISLLPSRFLYYTNDFFTTRLVFFTAQRISLLYSRFLHYTADFFTTQPISSLLYKYVVPPRGFRKLGPVWGRKILCTSARVFGSLIHHAASSPGAGRGHRGKTNKGFSGGDVAL